MFAGQYFDSETQLHYNYFRYYDPQTGRYTTSDPIGLAGGINTYGYGLQNPMKYTDRFGLAVDSFWSLPLPYFPTKDEHLNRNRNNKCPSREPDIKNACPIDDFEKDKDGGLASLLNGKLKYRSPKGSECTYDSNGNLLPDENGNYTYNYDTDGGLFHGYQDVLPHFLYGGNKAYTPSLTREE